MQDNNKQRRASDLLGISTLVAEEDLCNFCWDHPAHQDNLCKTCHEDWLEGEIKYAAPAKK